MSVRQAAVRSLRAGRIRAALGTTAVVAALALGGAVTAHAASAAADGHADTQKAHTTSQVTSTSSGKHTKPYVPGESSETDVPPDAQPAQPAQPGSDAPGESSETDVPPDAQPAQPAQVPATPAG